MKSRINNCRRRRVDYINEDDGRLEERPLADADSTGSRVGPLEILGEDVL